MMNKSFNIRSTLQGLQIIVFLSAILYFGRDLIIPVLYGLLVAIVLYPLSKKLERFGWPRSLAISFGLLIILILFSALVGLLVFQLNILRKDVPTILHKLSPLISDVQNWISVHLGYSIDSQKAIVQNAAKSVTSNAGSILRTTLSETAATLVTLFLVPIYAALFLYNRGSFVLFLEKVVGDANRVQLHYVLSNIILTYFNFIKGTAIVYLIVGILNSIGLLALGINHAILFGMLTAVMTIIPYIGIILSALLPICVAWVTKDSLWYPVGVVVVFAVVQYLEGNIIFPRVVGAQLKLSTWATLVAVIAGGLLWGVSGMILFLPVVGILKIVTDHVPSWKALNVLLSRES